MNIETLLEEFKSTFLPPDFEWRKGQKEAIIQIIQTYKAQKHKFVILDAPVGSGKSLIAMAFSWIMNKIGKKGYILASDISLQEQYETDFKNYNLNWGSIKGLNNYDCTDNFEKHPLGTCRMKGIPAQRMHCYDECPYYSNRDRASRSDTSLMNYAYWMIMQNYVNQDMTIAHQFPKRAFTICDEGHKILDIVQNQYTPKIGEGTIKIFEKLAYFFSTHHVKNLGSDLEDIRTIYDKIKEEENQERLLGLLKELKEAVYAFVECVDLLKTRAKDEYEGKSIPKEWRKSLQNSNIASDFYTKIKDFIEVIEKTSSRNIVKNPQMKGDIVFNCLEENYMMQNYFHKHTGFTVIMSATFSDPKEYIKQMGIGTAKYIKVESTFDFSKSPIYYYNQKRMGFKHIKANLPWLNQTINNLLDEHKGENGIIHTASYKLTMDIQNGLSKKNKKRVLVYSGTDEKREVLEQMKRSKDKILMGPSLLEGLDLKDDWSRFQIFAKVPYLSLGDRFVKAKLTLNPGWYRWRAILSILQGIGRSIRTESDWAVTYILDASLSDLMRQHSSAFPIEFMKRVRVRKE